MCITADAAIFLDTRSDAYVGLPLEQARGLHAIVNGWPANQDASDLSETDVLATARTLVERGILIEAPDGSTQRASTASMPAIEGTLCDWDSMPWRHITALHVVCFSTSYLWARASLKYRSFQYVLDTIARMKARNVRTATSFDLDAARSAVAAFYHLRPFLYERRGKCLLDSLTLVRFLEMYGGICPTLVIAVRTRPFGAHSWVQHGKYILNGTPEYCLPYTPILTV
jgi:hypothetical protein